MFARHYLSLSRNAGLPYPPLHAVDKPEPSQGSAAQECCPQSTTPWLRVFEPPSILPCFTGRRRNSPPAPQPLRPPRGLPDHAQSVRIPGTEPWAMMWKPG